LSRNAPPEASGKAARQPSVRPLARLSSGRKAISRVGARQGFPEEAVISCLSAPTASWHSGQQIQHAFERMVGVNMGVVTRGDGCDGCLRGAGVERALDLRIPAVEAHKCNPLIDANLPAPYNE